MLINLSTHRAMPVGKEEGYERHSFVPNRAKPEKQMLQQKPSLNQCRATLSPVACLMRDVRDLPGAPPPLPPWQAGWLL